jgi:hypothetical protein
MSYGLYLKDEQNKLISDGSKIITAWYNNFAENCSSELPTDIYFYLPSQIQDIKHFRIYFQWYGYKLHNSFSTEDDLVIRSGGEHTHVNDNNSYSSKAGQPIDVVDDDRSTKEGHMISCGTGDGDLSPHSHTIAGKKNTSNSHTHKIYISVGMSDNYEHTHIIESHNHTLVFQTQELPLIPSVNLKYQVSVNNTILHLADQTTQVYNFALNDLSILNTGQHNKLTIALQNSGNIVGQVKGMYYIQAFMGV